MWQLQFIALQGLWLHGNLIRHLPEDIGRCSDLRQVSLAGNCLEDFPDSTGAWGMVRDLNLSGNRITRLPHQIGQLSMAPCFLLTAALAYLLLMSVHVSSHCFCSCHWHAQDY